MCKKQPQQVSKSKWIKKKIENKLLHVLDEEVAYDKSFSFIIFRKYGSRIVAT